MEYCIYETDDDYKARMVVNILKKNKIMTFCKNMGIQNLFGESKFFTGNDLIVGEIKIYVKEKDVGKAKRIINKVAFLKKEIRTIENDEVKRNAYIIQRSLLFSITSLFIVPFFFNLEYIIYSFKNNLKVKYILLVINILCLLFSTILCITSFEYVKLIWKGNFFITMAFSIGKYIELHIKKSKLRYIMVIIIILLIIGYNIIDPYMGDGYWVILL